MKKAISFFFILLLCVLFYNRVSFALSQSNTALKALVSEDSTTRQNALDDIAKYDDSSKENIAEKLINIYKNNQNSRSESFVLDALMVIGPSNTWPIIILSVKNNDYATYGLINNYLSRLKDPSIYIPDVDTSCSQLMGMISSGHENTQRKEAIYLLGELGTNAKSAIPGLTNTLSDDNEEIRTSSLEALYKIGTPSKEAVSTIIPFLHGKNDDVSEKAIIILSRMGADAADAIPYLLDILMKDTAESSYKGNNILAYKITLALNQIGVVDNTITSVMVVMLNNPDEDINRQALRYIEKIGPGARDEFISEIKSIQEFPSGIKKYAAELNECGVFDAVFISYLTDEIRKSESLDSRTDSIADILTIIGSREALQAVKDYNSRKMSQRKIFREKIKKQVLASASAIKITNSVQHEFFIQYGRSPFAIADYEKIYQESLKRISPETFETIYGHKQVNMFELGELGNYFYKYCLAYIASFWPNGHEELWKLGKEYGFCEILIMTPALGYK